MTVEAKLVDSLFESPAPGNFKYYADPDSKEMLGLNFVCPCGCGALPGVRFESDTSKGWKWNGDRKRPTVTPSIRLLSGCKWHGFLTDGVFRACADA